MDIHVFVDILIASFISSLIKFLRFLAPETQILSNFSLNSTVFLHVKILCSQDITFVTKICSQDQGSK